jgi:hypothetical protein
MDALEVYADSKDAIAFRLINGADLRCGESITTGLNPDSTSSNFESFDPLLGTTRQAHPSDCWDGLGTLVAGHGYTDFITVRYSEKVYIDSIELGENRGVGSVVSIEAWDYGTKSWFVMWSGPPDLEAYNYFKTNGLYRKFNPDLCQPPFKTDVVKIKMDAKTVDDWNELDYARMEGFKGTPPGLVDPSTLFFVPPPNMNCVSTFTYSLSDCGGDRSRTYCAPAVPSIYSSLLTLRSLGQARLALTCTPYAPRGSTATTPATRGVSTSLTSAC